MVTSVIPAHCPEDPAPENCPMVWGSIASTFAVDRRHAVVAIQSGAGGHRCSGFAFGDRYVITNFHCGGLGQKASFEFPTSRVLNLKDAPYESAPELDIAVYETTTDHGVSDVAITRGAPDPALTKLGHDLASSMRAASCDDGEVRTSGMFEWLFHCCASGGGGSGGPVFNREESGGPVSAISRCSGADNSRNVGVPIAQLAEKLETVCLATGGTTEECPTAVAGVSYRQAVMTYCRIHRLDCAPILKGLGLDGGQSQ